MSDIPDDIMLSARRAIASLPFDHIDPLGRKAVVVARAILAERKRCAGIAKLAGIEPGGVIGRANGREHQQGCFDAAAWIWTEIMEPCK